MQLNRKPYILALTLAGLAGCVDSIGFLQLGRYFVSFMSGNSTQLAVGLAIGDISHIGILAGILISFVSGVVLGTILSHVTGPAKQIPAVLSLVTASLFLAACLQEAELASFAIFFMALAMGAENITLQRDGDVVVSLTYMTGTLVKMGQRIAKAFLGGKKFAWVSFLLLWISLITGGIIGTVLFNSIGLKSLWIAASWSGFLAVLTLLSDSLRKLD